jgi:hypothetical protein
MNDDVIQLGGKKQNSFMDKVKESCRKAAI